MSQVRNPVIHCTEGVHVSSYAPEMQGCSGKGQTLLPHPNPVVSDAEPSQPHLRSRSNSDLSIAAAVWARMTRDRS